MSPPPATESDSASASPRRARILVIDDEPAIGWALGRVLRDHLVERETDARKALALLATAAPFDLILCDLMMPNMNGMDFFRAMGEQHPGYTDRVVFMTGGVCTREAEDFLARVKNRQVSKPFSADVLRAIVLDSLR